MRISVNGWMMAEEEIRITLRLPAPLRDKLQSTLDATKRSMNGEIVARLERSFLVNLEDLKDPAARLQSLAIMISEIAEGLKNAREEKLTEEQKKLIRMLHASETKDDDK